jgi:hypothetical protein
MENRSLAVVLLLMQAATCFAFPQCDPDTTKVGEICDISLADLHPTQFNVGAKQVVDTGKPKNVSARQAVIGPGGFYLLDGHHQATGLWLFDGQASSHMPIAICANWRNKNVQFWNLMQSPPSSGQQARTGVDNEGENICRPLWEKGSEWTWTWLKDRGEEKAPQQLPQTMGGLVDDPFRSLAGGMKGDIGNSDSNGRPFLEFYWADYLRQYFRAPADNREWAETKIIASIAVHCPQAQAVPGFKQDRAIQPSPVGDGNICRQLTTLGNGGPVFSGDDD